jgi:hypothetical protein
MVKMKKSRKKKALTSNWEGPYQFVAHENGNLDDRRICIIKDADGNQWEHLSCSTLLKKLKDLTF